MAGTHANISVDLIESIRFAPTGKRIVITGELIGFIEIYPTKSRREFIIFNVVETVV